MLDQFREDRLSLVRLGIKGDAPLVAVQHREIEAVDIGYVLELSSRRVADAGALDLQYVGTEPSQQLRAGRAGLDMRHVQDFHAFQCF